MVNKCGKLIRQELKERNWTQEHFVEISGISLKTLSGIINGKREITKLTAEKLEQALEIPVIFWLNND
jgi:HTH-type transcriptional regulator/antitoxin HigA